MDSVLVTVLLYNGMLPCSFNVPDNRLNLRQENIDLATFEKLAQHSAKKLHLKVWVKVKNRYLKFIRSTKK